MKNLRQYNNNKRKTFQALLFQTNKKYMNAFMLLLVAVELVPNEIFNSIKKEKNSPFATDVEQRRNLNPWNIWILYSCIQQSITDLDVYCDLNWCGSKGSEYQKRNTSNGIKQGKCWLSAWSTSCNLCTHCDRLLQVRIGLNSHHTNETWGCGCHQML